jgi:DNA-binding response OmpR family regulator
MPRVQPSADHGPPTVLIVEDNQLIALDLETMLSEAGYRVFGSAATYAQALDLASQRGFDCALLDVELPDGDCTGIAEMLTTAGVPFALTTGLRPSDLDRPILRDAPVVAKPFRTADLLAAVGRLLS